MQVHCDVSMRGLASVSFMCSVKEKRPIEGARGGSNPLVTGQLFITSLEYLPDCIRFYCVFIWRADFRSQFCSRDREGKRTFRDHSGS